MDEKRSPSSYENYVSMVCPVYGEHHVLMFRALEEVKQKIRYVT